ncbi:S-adenosyl-L-methionine-dependent methyltransferase [Periconia macrospinosa]|uniref:S-adenosyl-L-methionine-dependent methyltransferase n=1 Tax=Periconia macrospinosa TaxID=97972 RepID=A0A2V1DA25_9PLEO|nr:S-adenosyl-L-methionine-dependent methyltransferase [Periconia macrospinosa]
MEAKRQDLLRLLAAAQATASELQEDLKADANFRLQVTEGSKRLTRTLQTEVDRAWELFLRPAHSAALHVALDGGWIGYINSNHVQKHGSETSGISAGQIAEHTSSDPELVSRLMRVLTANETIVERGADLYAPTPFSKLFDDLAWANGLRHAVRDYSITMAGMPGYFSKNGYRIDKHKEGAYQYVHGTTFFDRVHAGGEVGAEFHSFMRVVRAGKKPWFEVYPFADRLKGASESDVLLVDVGGGYGHDLIVFSNVKEGRNVPGRLVLQDAPGVLEKVSQEQLSRIDIQAHDFFTPQKVLGARAYFLKNVLHDWTNERCVDILSQLRDAMHPGYSRLLINEIVVPDENCDPWTAAFGIAMMAVVDGQERTRTQWVELINATGGLKIEMIWKLGTNNESIIEVSRIVDE